MSKSKLQTVSEEYELGLDVDEWSNPSGVKAISSTLDAEISKIRSLEQTGEDRVGQEKYVLETVDGMFLVDDSSADFIV
jgi:hypothetical protein